MTADDLWTRLGWRRATALSIHFFSTLHPTTVPCLAYDEEGWTLYMFSIVDGSPSPWPKRTYMGTLGPIDCPRLAKIFVIGPDGRVVSHNTDWPNATDACLMLRFGKMFVEGQAISRP